VITGLVGASMFILCCSLKFARGMNLQVGLLFSLSSVEERKVKSHKFFFLNNRSTKLLLILVNTKVTVYSGTILVKWVSVSPDDTAESLKARTQSLEDLVFIKAMKNIKLE
jgi:hypothetical protein